MSANMGSFRKFGFGVLAFLVTCFPLLLVTSGYALAKNRSVGSITIPSKLTIASSNNFPPINYLDADGELTGFGKDISDAVAANLGIAVERIHSPIWTNVLDALASGKADLIHDTGYTADRDKFLDYTRPIISMDEVIFVKPNRVDIFDIETLSGKKVACVDKHISHLYLKKFPRIKCHIVRRPIDGLTALLADEVDAFVYPKEIMLYFAQSTGLINKLKITGTPLRTLTWSMTVPEGQHNLISVLNKGIENIKANGVYDQIYEKWFGTRVLSGYSLKELLFVTSLSSAVAILAAIALALLIRNRKILAVRSQLTAANRDLLETKYRLIDSGLRIREIENNIPGIFFQISLSPQDIFSINYLSENIKEFTGHGSQYFKESSENFFYLIPKYFRQDVIQSLLNSGRSSTIWSEEFPLSDQMGGVKWFKGSAEPKHHDHDDSHIKFSGILLDISKERHYKDIQEEFFRLSVDMLCVANDQGYFVEVSPSWSDCTGYSIEELTSRPFLDFVHADDKDSTIAETNALVIEHDIVVDFENRYICKNGTAKWLCWSATFDKTARKIYATARDVTEQKKVHALLQKSNFELERRVKERTESLQVEIKQKTEAKRAANERENHLRSILNNIGDAIITLDADNVILSANPATEVIFGYSAKSLLGQNASNIIIGLPSATELNHSISESIQRKSKHTRELIGKKRNGALIYTEISFTRLGRSNGKTTICIIRNITGAKKNQQRLTRAKYEAERASRAKSEFLSRMSHELRTPLNAILGFSQVLEIDLPRNSPESDCAGEVVKAGKHLLGLIDEILDLSRIESGHIDLEIKKVNITQTLDETITLLSNQINERRLSVVKNYQDNNIIIDSDYKRIKQIILNLLSNAIKYNKEQGGIELSLDITQGGFMHLSVKDTGIGIKKNQIQHLFKPFNRLDAARSNIQGTGIGLVVTKSLVELLGGTMSVSSTENAGSTFTIRLPAKQNHQEISAEFSQQPDNNKIFLEIDHDIQILLVEDNPANRKFIRSIFSRYPSITLVEAKNGQQGLSELSNNEFDLLLLDIDLPDISGIEVVKNVRKNTQTQSLPIIALSANAMSEDIKIALKSGFDDYVVKPVNIPVLVRSINTLLAKKQASLDDEALGIS